MTDSPTASESRKAIESFVNRIGATPDGERLTLSVLRRSSEEGSSSTRSPIDVEVIPRRRPIDGDGRDRRRPALGVRLVPRYLGTVSLERPASPFGAIRLAGRRTIDATRGTFRAFVSVPTSALRRASGSTSASDDGGASLAGPVAVLSTGSRIVGSGDGRAVVEFAAVLSVNLAVLNALPLPTLDGGRLLFLLVEALTPPRRIDPRTRNAVETVASLFLLALALATTLRDVSRIPPP